MAGSVRVQQLDGVTGATGAVAVVCDGAHPAGQSPWPSSSSGAVHVDAVMLSSALATIDPAIEILVFLTGARVAADGAVGDDEGVIALLVDRLSADADHVAAIRRVPAVNAAKRVQDGVVVESVDRSTLNLLRPPEVVDRAALEAALRRLSPAPGDDPVNPTLLAASAGSPVLVVDTDLDTDTDIDTDRD